jgi:hypothetical protein
VGAEGTKPTFGDWIIICERTARRSSAGSRRSGDLDCWSDMREMYWSLENEFGFEKQNRVERERKQNDTGKKVRTRQLLIN